MFLWTLAFLLEGPINTRFTGRTSLSPPVRVASPRNSALSTQRPMHCPGLLLADVQELVGKQVDTGMNIPLSEKVLRPVIFYMEIPDQYSL